MFKIVFRDSSLYPKQLSLFCLLRLISASADLNGYISNFCSMIELLHELKKSFFKHGSIQEVDNVSAGKNENQKFAGRLYIRKNWTFSSVLHAYSQFLCSLARFDLSNRGVRQPVQPHSFNARLLVFDKTSAQPHFAAVNCLDAVMSVFYSLFNAQPDNFAFMNCCVVALIEFSFDILAGNADSLYAMACARRSLGLFQNQAKSVEIIYLHKETSAEHETSFLVQINYCDWFAWCMVTAVALLLLLNDKCKPESLQRVGRPGWRFPQTAGCKARTCFVLSKKVTYAIIWKKWRSIDTCLKHIQNHNFSASRTQK